MILPDCALFRMLQLGESYSARAGSRRFSGNLSRASQPENAGPSKALLLAGLTCLWAPLSFEGNP
jgi:hypothetical protein